MTDVVDRYESCRLSCTAVHSSLLVDEHAILEATSDIAELPEFPLITLTAARAGGNPRCTQVAQRRSYGKRSKYQAKRLQQSAKREGKGRVLMTARKGWTTKGRKDKHCFRAVSEARR